MRHNPYENRCMMYIAIMFFINIAPIEMQTMTIEVTDLDLLVTSSLNRLLGAIDPTMGSFQNTTSKLLSFFEDRIKVNALETLYWFQTNLLLLLFAVIVLFIFICILLILLDILFTRYEYSPAERRFIGLIVITIIFVWLFIASALSAWPPNNKLDLQALKYAFVSLLSLVILYFIIIWICYLYTHRTNLSNYLRLLCGCDATDRTLKRGIRKASKERLELIDGHF